MKENPFEDIEMLHNPLLTEEGFVNEACINELESWIKNLPRTHERLADDPEWNTPRWTNYRSITGGLAHWAVQQLSTGNADPVPPPACPPNLEKVLGYLQACILSKFDDFGLAKLSLCDISKMLYDTLWDLEVFMAWNTEECLGSYWLDLDALLHNVCLSIRQDRREFDRFNKEFEESQNATQKMGD